MGARQLGLLLWKNSILKRRSYLGIRVPVSRSRRLSSIHFAAGCVQDHLRYTPCTTGASSGPAVIMDECVACQWRRE